MATVNFSVPDDVKAAFNEAFEGRNKSAVIADLMREAVGRILERRRARRDLADEAIRRARNDGRP